MKKRIVVTGMGVVSCFGNDVKQFYESLLEGKSGVKPISSFPCEDLTTRFAATIPEFDPGDYVEKKMARRADKCIVYCLVSGKKALEDAGLTGEALQKINKERAGVLMGSGMGGMTTFADGAVTLKEKGLRRLTPFFVPFILTNMGGALLAMDVGFMGPNYSVSTACATANYAIINAAKHIEQGDADVMVCGGFEAPILPLGVAGFCAIKALSERNDEPERASRPFDKARDGFVMGEGSGVLILEELEHAKVRGAKIYAEYLGGAFSCDAYHMTEPRNDGAGVALCIRNALKEANVQPSEVNYVNAHATATPLGDIAELEAMKKVFVDPSKVVVSATKSMIGHSLGAAGALEAVATIMAIQTGKIHPTINLENPEEGLSFHVPTKMLERDVNVAISNSFGFGGHNASVVFGKY